MPDRDFTRVHPEYNRWRDRWQMAWDFYRGGLHVLQPGYEQEISFYIQRGRIDGDESETGPQADGYRRGNRFEWQTTRWNSYLWSHERETINRFADRNGRATHIPIVRPVADALVSGVLRTAPMRNTSAAFPWQFYLRDVDRAGTPVDIFVRKALTMAVVFGKCFAVSDKPIVDSPPPSLAAQLERGERAYTYLLTPLDVPDWSVDELGNFNWIVLREKQPDDREPGAGGENFGKDQYRVWFRDHWELWQAKSSANRISRIGADAESYELVDSGPNPLGRVPVQVLYARRGQDSHVSLESDSLITDIVDTDRSVYNLLSLLHEIEYSQTFSQMTIPGEAGDFGPIEMGPWSAFVYPAESGGSAPTFISPNPSIASGLWDRIVGLIRSIQSAAGTSRGMAEASKEGRSAAAIAFESEEKYVQMSALAEQVDEWEMSVYRDVAELSGVSYEDAPLVRRPRRFDLRSVSQQISDLVQLWQLKLGPKPTAAVAKPVVARLLKEQGLQDSDVESILNDIDEGAQQAHEARSELMEKAPGVRPEFSVDAGHKGGNSGT